jgi:hypothetical protein
MDKHKVLIALVSAILVFQIFSMFRARRFMRENFHAPSSSSPQLFIDSRGEVVDPYAKRQVKNTLTANARDIQSCFNSFVAKNPASTGKGSVFLDWIVSPQGRASRVRVVSNELPDSSFESCLKSSIEGWDFPPSDETHYAEHRLSFSKAL